MPRGRKPKPTALKELAGNPGHRPLNENEPRPEAENLRCPAHLKGEARKAWLKVSKKLYELGVLTGLDEMVLETLCAAYQAWFIAHKMVGQEGELLPPPVQGQERETLFGTDKPQYSSAQMVVNPWAYRRDKQAQILQRLAAEYGLTPSSRARLQGKPDDPDDVAKDLFGDIENSSVAAGERLQ